MIALQLATRTTGMSREAATVRDAACRIVASTERSIALFGAKSSVIDRIHELALECAAANWDGEDGAALSSHVVARAVSFVRVMPYDLPLPDVAPEPDGSISFDWIVTRRRMFSVSVGVTNRLSFAWIDGTDRGHGVARFDGDTIPSRVLDGIRHVTHAATAAVGIA